jgi:hypothetical protein
MLPRLPTELLMIIYDYSDTSTRIKLNTAFKWSYYFKNPLYKLQIKKKLEYRTLVKSTTFYRMASIGGATIILPY